MLFIAEKGREQELIDIFHRWELQAVVAGEVIAEPIVRILFKGEVAAEVPASALSDNTPIYHRELMAEPPEYATTAWAWNESQLPEATAAGIGGQSWEQVLLKLLDTPTIASKRWVYRQYDHQVQNNTVVFPGGADAAIVRVRPLANATSATDFTTPPTQIGVAATTDCNSRYVYLHPYEGAKMAVAEAARNLSCVGAEPIAVTDNLNFGSPEKPIGYWQLANACKGISEACREFETPVTGGNVSLYNETLDSNGNPQPIYPTPVIGMVGRVENLSRIAGQAWQGAGDRIYLLGMAAGATSPALTLGGSEYLAVLHETIAGQPPIVDFDLERRVQAACRHGIREGWVRSAHDSAEGGLAVAIAESCISSNHGAVIDLAPGTARLDHLLFAEGGARIVVSVAAADCAAWEAYLAANLADDWQAIGSVGHAAGNLQITAGGKSLIDAPVSGLISTWGGAIERRLEA
jgi:phosphoribosylformylglycinamidine synthase subunit PurL